jgi:hypothetical protein
MFAFSFANNAESKILIILKNGSEIETESVLFRGNQIIFYKGGNEIGLDISGVEAITSPEPEQNIPKRSYSQPAKQKQSTATSRKTSKPGTRTTKAEDMIKKHCTEKWPDNYRMQSYCTDQQREAVRKLAKGAPQDIKQEDFQKIRNKCGSKWWGNFRMQSYCEDQQIEAYRKMRGY